MSYRVRKNSLTDDVLPGPRRSMDRLALLPAKMLPRRLPESAASPYSAFSEGSEVAQAVIAESAINKAQEAGPDGLAKFVVRLSDGLFTPEEISALNNLGMTEYLPFFRQALVVLPACRLLDLAELPSVVQIV